MLDMNTEKTNTNPEKKMDTRRLENLLEILETEQSERFAMTESYTYDLVEIDENIDDLIDSIESALKSEVK